MKYKMIDLCAGIGGIRRGFEMTKGFKTVLSSEIDTVACRVYEHLYGENPFNDLTSDDFKNKVKKTEYDILLAGFPCQTFSRAGKKEGFENSTKGNIFFHIAEMIQQTRPKCIFLENVDHLVTHDKGKTFEKILEVLINDLDYTIAGVEKKTDGTLSYSPKNFIKNSRDFGIPQNRPRVYIVGFDNKRYKKCLENCTLSLPVKRNDVIYKDLNELLDKKVDAKFFMSSGYLKTLEKHAEREKSKGNGFGYKIVNAPVTKNPMANTILATGGSGKERNLIYDEKGGKKYANISVSGKLTPINDKNIRVMTPAEWGKLQGFINYAFIGGDGSDKFSFPDGIADAQRYKLFGNAVTIPVIEQLAYFVKDILLKMDNLDD